MKRLTLLASVSALALLFAISRLGRGNRELRAGHAGAAQESRARQLAAHPAHLRRPVAQPAHADHAREREGPEAGLDRHDRSAAEGDRVRRPARRHRQRGAGHGQQRGDDRFGRRQPDHRARRQGRQGDLALRLQAAGGAGAGASDQSRRGALGGQALLRPPSTRTSWRSTPRPEPSSGTRRSRTGRRAITRRSRRSW